MSAASAAGSAPGSSRVLVAGTLSMRATGAALGVGAGTAGVIDGAVDADGAADATGEGEGVAVRLVADAVTATDADGPGVSDRAIGGVAVAATSPGNRMTPMAVPNAPARTSRPASSNSGTSQGTPRPIGNAARQRGQKPETGIVS